MRHPYHEGCSTVKPNAMRRIVVITAILLAVILLLGLLATSLGRNRDAANHVLCANNLRVLALLGTPFTRQEDKVLVAKTAPPPASVWPGTVMNANLKPDERLSWVALAQPNWNDQPLALDMNAAWNAAVNQAPSHTVLRNLLCPGKRPLITPSEPAPTSYVGIAGVGEAAATLPMDAPDAGAFRYEGSTPLSYIASKDGLSNTFLFGQTVHAAPWIRGGPGTVRSFLDSTPILSRAGGQFGGALADGAYFARCDGSARLFRYTTDDRILKAMATIAGGPVNED